MKVSNPSVTEFLARDAKEDPDPVTRQNLLKSLAKYHESHPGVVTSTFSAALDDRDDNVRHAARDFLKNVRASDEGETRQIIEALKTRSHHADLLLHDPLEPGVLETHLAISQFPKRLESWGLPLVELRNRHGIGTILPALIRAAEHGDGKVSTGAVTALALLAPENVEAVRTVVRILQSDTRPIVHDSASVALSRMLPTQSDAQDAVIEVFFEPGSDNRGYRVRHEGLLSESVSESPEAFKQRKRIFAESIAQRIKLVTLSHQQPALTPAGPSAHPLSIALRPLACALLGEIGVSTPAVIESLQEVAHTADDRPSQTSAYRALFRLMPFTPTKANYFAERSHSESDEHIAALSQGYALFLKVAMSNPTQLISKFLSEVNHPGNAKIKLNEWEALTLDLLDSLRRNPEEVANPDQWAKALELALPKLDPSYPRDRLLRELFSDIRSALGKSENKGGGLFIKCQLELGAY
jgi:hypothetical protein